MVRRFPAYIVAVLVFLSVVAGGCRRNAFTLDIALQGDFESNYRIIYHARAKGAGSSRESGIALVGGKARMELPSQRATVAYLYPRTGLPIAIFVEKGADIKISGDSPDPYTWNVGGNKVNEQLSEWRRENAGILQKGDTDSINMAVARYVYANPDSPAAPVLLLTSFSRRNGEKAFRRLWNLIRDTPERNSWIELTGRTDLAANHASVPGKLINMVVRSFHNGADTVSPSSAKATLLYFWHSGENSRTESIDSLKALAKEFPDSAVRIIADISLDHDSISWVSPLGHDSVKNIARLWMPAGLADKRAMQLDVTRTPFYIVLSPEGKQVERGSDLKEAVAAFRRLAAKEEKPGNAKRNNPEVKKEEKNKSSKNAR